MTENFYILVYLRTPIGESGESCNSTYDLSFACKVCGTGAMLAKHLIVKSVQNVKERVFCTINGDFLINEETNDLIKKSFPTFDLLNVKNSKGVSLKYFHLYTKTSLPPLDINSSGFIIENQCPYCKRNGHANDVIIGNLEENIPTIIKPLNLAYSKIVFSPYETEILLKTWECAGHSNIYPNDKFVTRYARPWLIIREEIKEIFEKIQPKHLKYLPLTIKK